MVRSFPRTVAVAQLREDAYACCIFALRERERPVLEVSTATPAAMSPPPKKMNVIGGASKLHDSPGVCEFRREAGEPSDDETLE